MTTVNEFLSVMTAGAARQERRKADRWVKELS